MLFRSFLSRWQCHHMPLKGTDQRGGEGKATEEISLELIHEKKLFQSRVTRPFVFSLLLSRESICMSVDLWTGLLIGPHTHLFYPDSAPRTGESSYEQPQGWEWLTADSAALVESASYEVDSSNTDWTYDTDEVSSRQTSRQSATYASCGD